MKRDRNNTSFFNLQDLFGAVKGDSLTDTLLDILPYLPRETWLDAARFYRIIRKSGADNFAAWVALYRWTASRDLYAGIREGLEQYFKDHAAAMYDGVI